MQLNYEFAIKNIILEHERNYGPIKGCDILAVKLTQMIENLDEELLSNIRQKQKELEKLNSFNINNN